MYAIRSYYGERIEVGQIHPLGLLVKLHDAQIGDDHLGTAVAGQARTVITSYSIHYTKLYELRIWLTLIYTFTDSGIHHTGFMAGAGLHLLAVLGQQKWVVNALPWLADYSSTLQAVALASA